MTRLAALLAACVAGCLTLQISAEALAYRTDAIPVSRGGEVAPLAALEVQTTPPLDRRLLAREDAERAAEGLPYRFAAPHPVRITPQDRGTWESLPDGRWLWRLRIDAPGVLSLTLGFTRFWLPWGGRLLVYPVTGGPALGFTSADNADHGELWTPVLLTGELVIELILPAGRRHDYQLELAAINRGYRYFGEDLAAKSGACNVDVICPEGDDWRNEIRSIGVYTLNGVWKCTGALINNSAQDGTPYFLTAYHCNVNASNDASLVVYWNFESPVCGEQGGGSLAQSQSGSTWRAGYSVTDFTLLELDQVPNGAFAVPYVGWNRSDADPTSAVAIHHPSTDEKSISFENDPCTTTSYLQHLPPGNGTHIRVEDWDLGTTEAGSSGSPLFDQNHHLVGQLHGGYAACDNDLADWYGRFSISWNGGGGAGTRLRDWLDPLGSAPLTLPLYDPLHVTPDGGFLASGDPGGPFSPTSMIYTLHNSFTEARQYAVAADVAWVTVSDGSGTLAAGDSAAVTVAIAAVAADFGNGAYRGTLTFTNLTDGRDDATRPLELRIGEPGVIYSNPLDSDPGWMTEAAWAFGSPAGLGGENGHPDPAAGHTGSNVYGYNLSGDYDNYLPASVLRTGAFDLTDNSGVQLRFWRWLGVEQPQYDQVAITVEVDGGAAVTVWANQDEITDDAWVQVSYDVSALVDGHAQVVFSWVLGPTDGFDRYCGWNIDDIELVGFGDFPLPQPSRPGPVVLPTRPNPFGPGRQTVELCFVLPADAHARLAIYDLRGRHVVTVADELFPQGESCRMWDGYDDEGRRVVGGVYICRLESDVGTAARTLTAIP